ncbi:hypothetical protein I3271_16010 [Photobacterium leiognathi]|uniref:hypothetical protein n=1 Tax=Photobacterium leiognathi TaxID=553611 RepID=UPI001EDD93E8|nr:hypothetical protein [Photobacterium leiognathi]MCG3886176.1 hypothetical protein [Photobacterium leiognathi]
MHKFAMVALVVAVMAGCKGGSGSDDGNNGNGGNDGNGGVTTVASEAGTRTELSNLANANSSAHVSTDQSFPRPYESAIAVNNEYECYSTFCSLDGNPVSDATLWRHELGDEVPLIPVYFAIEGEGEGVKDQRALDALKIVTDAIYPEGNGKVFEDKGFIRFAEGTLTSTSIIDYSDAANRGKGGLIISLGTSQPYYDVSKQSRTIMCGSVTSHPLTMGTARQIIDTRGAVHSDKGWTWLNLGNEETNCGFDTGIAAHELAHYLYLGGKHFHGFGEGNTETFGDPAKALLHTIYRNPLESTVDSMEYTWNDR